MTKHENMPKSGQKYLKIKQKTCLSPVGKDDFYLFCQILSGYCRDACSCTTLTLVTTLDWGFIPFQHQMLLSPQSHALLGMPRSPIHFGWRWGKKKSVKWKDKWGLRENTYPLKQCRVKKELSAKLCPSRDLKNVLFVFSSLQLPVF